MELFDSSPVLLPGVEGPPQTPSESTEKTLQAGQRDQAKSARLKLVFCTVYRTVSYEARPKINILLSLLIERNGASLWGCLETSCPFFLPSDMLGKNPGHIF